jgi:hypothetical protein
MADTAAGTPGLDWVDLMVQLGTHVFSAAIPAGTSAWRNSEAYSVNAPL